MNPPKFLSRKARQAQQEPTRATLGARAKLAGRAHRLTQQADNRLVACGTATQLHPCPECDGSGLHKARCGFYLDRSKIQAKTNPNPSFNGYLGWVAKATGPMGALS